MFSPFAISLLTSLSVMAWVYTKALRRTGGNNQNALISAGLAGLAVFVIVMTIVNLVDSFLE